MHTEVRAGLQALNRLREYVLQDKMDTSLFIVNTEKMLDLFLDLN